MQPQKGSGILESKIIPKQMKPQLASRHKSETSRGFLFNSTEDRQVPGKEKEPPQVLNSWGLIRLSFVTEIITALLRRVEMPIAANWGTGNGCQNRHSQSINVRRRASAFSLLAKFRGEKRPSRTVSSFSRAAARFPASMSYWARKYSVSSWPGFCSSALSK